jgi:hypothetical protein
MSSDLQYPIGKFDRKPSMSETDRLVLIEEIASLPDNLALAVEGLTDAQLDTPYRDGGWTVRQVVHHLADSHLNAYLRMKLAATESNPAIKTYDEKAWAEQADARTAPVDLSLEFLDALHNRWTWWLRTLQPHEFERAVEHPELSTFRVDDMVQLYAWHSRHHLAHITGLVERNRW